MTGLSRTQISSTTIAVDGVRPVNLRTDLRPLADLIELVFADSMDSSGRTAIREMRYLSHVGYGLHLVSRLNELALGISMGYVYVIDGQLVGNVSVYPSGYPKDMRDTWILANIGVHPAYQRRGIASDLVSAALEMIANKRGRHVILQVNHENIAALRLYERLGFVYERAWCNWRRSGYIKSPLAEKSIFPVTRLRQSEWRSEYELAQAARPNSRGGLGWQKPLHISYFRVPWWQRLLNQISLNHVEKLVIRSDESDQIVASCWLESLVSSSNIRLRLFAAPSLDHRPYVEALLRNVLSRFPRATITVEHPRDDNVVNELLTHYQFKVKRDLWNMRLDL